MKLLMRALLLMLMSCSAVAQQPYCLPGVTAVEGQAPIQAVTVTMVAGGQLDSVRVLTQGSAGFDFTDAGGGSCAAGTTYLPGQSCTVRLSFKPTYPGERRGAIVLLPRSGGGPLATQLLTASATGAVLNFVPGTITTVAGNAAWIYAGDSQPATQTSIFLPFGIAVDAAGNLFLTDSSNSRIRRVDVVTGLVSTIAGSGTIGATGDGGPAVQATLSNPTSILLDPAGNVFFTDSGNNVVRRIDAYTGVLTTYAGRLGSHGFTGDGAAATAATLNGPNGIALDAAGNLYIADSGNQVIRLVNAATGLITTIAGRGGRAGYSGDGGPALAATLASPWSITLASTGELYIADQNNHSIRRVSLEGVISTIAGNGAAGFAGDGQPASASQLNEPASVAIDVAGNLYIADSGNNRVRKINGQTGKISTIAGTSGESFSGDGGPADQAGLYGPYALALDGQDSLYIADVFHNRIRKIAGNAAALTFPAIRVGRVSDPVKQSLENGGNAPLTFAAIVGTSNAQVDAMTTGCVTTNLLLPFETCSVGVDFAPLTTGNPVLGTVAIKSDAANSPALINLSGQVLDIDPTTLTLTANVNPALTGHPVILTVTASSAGSTPTGTVSFYEGTVLLGTVTLQNGTGSFTLDSLPAGQHSVTAVYSGDSSNATATSAPWLEVVREEQAATVTTLGSSANPSIAGASLALTATVAVKTAGAGNATMAGSVAFFDGATQIGAATIDAGSATFDRGTAVLNVNSLAVRSHSVTAVYAGNTTDAASTSTALPQAVQMATTKMVLGTSANPSVAGAALTLSATVLGNGGVPAGNVRFTDGTTVLGAAPLNAQGIATLQVAGPYWLPGSRTLTATYDGDAEDSATTSPAILQVVKIAQPSVTLTSTLNPSGLGAQVGITATVSGLGGIPSGAVQFYDGAALLGNATLDAQGIATLATAALKLGAHSVTAIYAGDAYDANGTSAVLTQTVESATIAATLAASKNPALFGDSVTFTAQISGSGSKPAGTVSFLDGTVSLGTVTLDANGQATLSTAALSIGAHPVTAVYSGDTNHPSTTTAPLTLNVLQSTSTVLGTSGNHVFAGLAVTLNAAVAGLSGRQVGGSVDFLDGTIKLATVPVNANGSASYAALLPSGQHNITAVYAGDASNAASTSTAVSETVETATTTTTLTSSANPSPFGASLTLTAVVASAGAAPTGAIVFHDGTTVLATVPIAGTTATLSLTSLSPGIHAIFATYAGDPNNQPSQSATVQQQVALQTSVRLTSNANPALLGETITLTVATGNGSAAVPTGTVAITDGSALLFTGTLTNGTATFSLASATLGKHPLTAAYQGDAQNAPATSAVLVQSVTLRPTTTSLTASSTAVSAGQQLILISVVQASQPGAQAPSGTVTFQAGSTVLSTQTITSAGVATVTLTPAQAALNIVASYSGDALYAASTSTAVVVTVGPPVAFNLTANPPTLTLQSGQRATLGIALASAPTFKDTLAFGCAGLPQYATCTFSVSQMAIASGAPQALTVTVDTGNPLGAGSAAMLLPISGLVAFALRRRRRLTGVLLAGLLALTSVTGCASSFQQSKTAAGDYTFQVVATGNQTGAQSSVAIHMTVTQ